MKLKKVAILSIGAILALIMVFLGLWQASTYRTQGAEATRQRAQEPPVSMPASPSGTQIAELYGRQVIIEGRYLPEHQVFVGEKPPYRVVTAFRVKDGGLIAVARGTVDAGQRPSDAPTGIVRQTGLLMPSEKDKGSLGASAAPTPGISELRLEHLVQTWPTPLANGFVSLGERDARAQGLQPAVVRLPEGQGSQRNAGYALQWWSFAVFAMAMSIAWARSVKE